VPALTQPLDVNIPHFNSIGQLLSNIWTLVEHIADKNEEQQNKCTELSYNKMDAEEKVLHANSHIQSLEIELKTTEANLLQVQADCHQFEQQLQERSSQLAETQDIMRNYKELNEDLCLKVEKLET